MPLASSWYAGLIPLTTSWYVASFFCHTRSISCVLWCYMNKLSLYIQHIHIVVCTLSYIHAYIHAYCVPTYMHTYMRTCIRTYIHTYLRTCVHTYIHTRTYTHTYTHTPLDACGYTRPQVLSQSQAEVGESQVVVIEGDTGCGTFGWFSSRDLGWGLSLGFLGYIEFW